MKTITRTVTILLAALLVVGVTMAFTNSSNTAQAAPSGQSPQMDDGTFVPGGRPEGRPVGESGSAFGWLRHLLPIAGIVFVVVVIERLWGKIFKPRPVHVTVE